MLRRARGEQIARICQCPSQIFPDRSLTRVQMQNESSAKQQAQQQAENIIRDLDSAVKYVLDGERQHPNRNDQVVTNTGPFRASGTGFGQGSAAQGTASSQSSTFASQPSASSGFGQPSQLGARSTFGQASQPGGSGSFGQPSQSGGPSFSGQGSALAQPAPTSTFGQASAMGGASGTFGRPSSMGANSTLTQSKQPAFGQSGFGQAAAPTFGQVSQPFGQQQQTTTFGGHTSQPSGFPAAPGQPSAFGQVGQGQQQNVNPFGQTSAATPSGGFGSSGTQAGSNPFAAGPAGGSAFGQPSQQNKNPFGQASQPANDVFGSSPVVNPTTPSAFGRISRPAANTNGAFGAPSNGTATASAATSQPNNLPTGIAATTSYTTRTANGTLQRWKGAEVMYDDDRLPTYQHPQTGNMERIWHPNGPPEVPNLCAEAAPEMYLGELGAVLKDLYEYVGQTGQFKDGVVPEVPPKREWLHWDL